MVTRREGMLHLHAMELAEVIARLTRVSEKSSAYWFGIGHAITSSYAGCNEASSAARQVPR